jgi:hypothetical protein
VPRVLPGIDRGRIFSISSAVREYVAAFKEAGIGAETEAAEVVADRIRSSAVLEQLVAAVDDWAAWVGNQPARRAWLLAVARAADPDPWRDRFRDAAVWEDRTALERLAREAKMNELSPQVLSALTSRLLERNADATSLLREARRGYPSDFWLNLGLGSALCDTGRWEDVLVYCQAAVALRPAAAAMYNNLGVALRGRGRVNEAIACHSTVGCTTYPPPSRRNGAIAGGRVEPRRIALASKRWKTAPIAITNLWDLEFGDGTPQGGKTNQLFFDAEPNAPHVSINGLFGVIRPAGKQGGKSDSDLMGEVAAPSQREQ